VLAGPCPGRSQVELKLEVEAVPVDLKGTAGARRSRGIETHIATRTHRRPHRQSSLRGVDSPGSFAELRSTRVEWTAGSPRSCFVDVRRHRS